MTLKSLADVSTGSPLAAGLTTSTGEVYVFRENIHHHTIHIKLTKLFHTFAIRNMFQFFSLFSVFVVPSIIAFAFEMLSERGMFVVLRIG